MKLLRGGGAIDFVLVRKSIKSINQLNHLIINLFTRFVNLDRVVVSIIINFFVSYKRASVALLVFFPMPTRRVSIGIDG